MDIEDICLPVQEYVHPKDIQTHNELWKEYSNCAAAHALSGQALMTEKEYKEFLMFEEMEAEQAAEQWAENAWLRHAENQYDPGFEQWEHSRLYS